MPIQNSPTDAAPAVLEIDLGAIVANWRLLSARHPGGPVAGVVKADGYGLGARQVAAALHAAGCRHFFVAFLDEAVAIRHLVPDSLLAVLGGLIPGTEDTFLAHGITPALASLDDIDRWNGRGPAILHVDTGMSRLGLDAGEIGVLATDPARLHGAPVRYIMSHMVSSEDPADPINPAQRQRFAAIRAALPPAPASLANSSAIFLGYGSDLARPGAALYGLNPTPGQPNPMHATVALRARVLALHHIPAGATVGYNATWTATRPTRIATVGVGYADGWHRSLSNRGTAFFDDTPIPLVGRVSMDLTTYDVTDVPAVQPGCWLELLGPHISADDVGVAAGTNGYEILTSLGRRYHRVYRTA